MIAHVHTFDLKEKEILRNRKNHPLYNIIFGEISQEVIRVKDLNFTIGSISSERILGDFKVNKNKTWLSLMAAVRLVVVGREEEMREELWQQNKRRKWRR